MDRAKNTYNGFTIFAALTMGFMSYRYRRMKISMVEAHEAAKGVSSFQWQDLINDAISIFLGFTMGNLLACDYIYKRRTYVIERLHFEKQSNFNRFAFQVEDGKFLDEYPFADYISLKDKDIVEDRIHPREVREHTEMMRERVDKINQEYAEK